MAAKIFVCYAREDELFLNQLKIHLKPLQRQGLIEIWHDREISAGADWEKEIHQRLDEAQIILLLISPDFINSEYCYSVEMQHALKRHALGEVQVIPVILRYAHWQGMLGHLQALPDDARPIKSWNDLDEALFKVTDGIRALIEKLAFPPISAPAAKAQQTEVRIVSVPQHKVDDVGGQVSSAVVAQVPPQTPQNQISARERFDRFTARARKVLSLAQEEAQRLQHNYIGTEHLLLGLIREEQGTTTRILGNFGIELQKVRSAVEFIIGRGDRMVLGEIGLTPNAKKVVEQALDEADLLKHDSVNPEHLLLALVDMDKGIAVGVLESLGFNRNTIRTHVRQVLSQNGSRLSSPGTSLARLTLPPRLQGRPSATEGSLSTVSSDKDRAGKFTEQARKALSLAQEEAQRLQHNYIGTEHLLLGLIREGEGVAAWVLSNFGVELNKVRSAVEFIIGRGDRIVSGEIGLTPRAKKVIELSVGEAMRLKHNYIGTEHLLLGMLLEGMGIGAGVLESLGADMEKVRTQTLQVLSQLE